MPNCPCCSDQLLRYVGHAQPYWFCRSCWQQMPILESEEYNAFRDSAAFKLAHLAPATPVVSNAIQINVR